MTLEDMLQGAETTARLNRVMVDPWRGHLAEVRQKLA
jgi:hypothetical protein